MSEPRTYPEGMAFSGVIGRTVGESEPAWPAAPAAKPGAPNVLLILLDDVGFAQIGCFGADIATRLECGTGWVNQHLNLVPNAPFGGSKWSGIGYENGTWGLAAFTELQVINVAKQ